jgi:hypothetical protein
MNQRKPRTSGSKASPARRAVAARKGVAKGKGKAAVGEDPASGKLERFTVNLQHGLAEEARDAAVALSGPPLFLTLSAFTRSAFRRELDRLRRQANKGRQFPRRGRPLRRGRPIGS